MPRPHPSKLVARGSKVVMLCHVHGPRAKVATDADDHEVGDETDDVDDDADDCDDDDDDADGDDDDGAGTHWHAGC